MIKVQYIRPRLPRCPNPKMSQTGLVRPAQVLCIVEKAITFCCTSMRKT